MNRHGEITCTRCKVPKAPCLYTPSELAKNRPLCRKCGAEKSKIQRSGWIGSNK